MPPLPVGAWRVFSHNIIRLSSGPSPLTRIICATSSLGCFGSRPEQFPRDYKLRPLEIVVATSLSFADVSTSSHGACAYQFQYPSRPPVDRTVAVGDDSLYRRWSRDAGPARRRLLQSPVKLTRFYVGAIFNAKLKTKTKKLPYLGIFNLFEKQEKVIMTKFHLNFCLVLINTKRDKQNQKMDSSKI